MLDVGKWHALRTKMEQLYDKYNLMNNESTPSGEETICREILDYMTTLELQYDIECEQARQWGNDGYCRR